MSLGQTIKEFRIKKGLSQKGLGDLCDPKIDASNIRRIENDTVSPTADTIIRIANALQLPIYDFFTETEEKAKIVTPLKAIRAKCLDCCCGNANDVKLCPVKDCALHPYRDGHNPSRKGIGNKKPNTEGIDAKKCW